MKKGIYIIIAAIITSFSANAGTAKHILNGKATFIGSGSIVGMKVNAIAVNHIGEVSWKAVKEVNVRRYELEKSNDGKNFNYVTAVAGNGKIIQEMYNAQDRNLSEGINYYRIKVVDKNGDFNYSLVIMLDTKATNEAVKILATPVSDKLHVWMSANTTISNALITDAAGRKLPQQWKIKNAANLADIEMAKLQPGFYTIQLTTNKGEIITHKFMKK